MVLVAVIALFGQNFRVVLPLLARDTFDGGAEVYGWLTSALGLGAVLGALVTASRERVSAWSLLMTAVAFGAFNILAAASPFLWMALTAMVTGASPTSCSTKRSREPCSSSAPTGTCTDLSHGSAQLRVPRHDADRRSDPRLGLRGVGSARRAAGRWCHCSVRGGGGAATPTSSPCRRAGRGHRHHGRPRPASSSRPT